MSRRLKYWLYAVLYFSGFTRIAAWRNRRGVTILCYHGVTRRPHRSPQDCHGLHVRIDRFLGQLEYLRRHYRVISLREYLAARNEGRKPPEYAVVVTFDDGFRNFLTVAMSPIAERRLPVTLFLITDWVASQPAGGGAAESTPADDETYLSWDEVELLQARWGVQLGSHTCSHRVLPAMAGDDAERELSQSLDAIRRRPNDGAPPLAYPYGAWSEVVAERARALGYACALTTEAGANEPGRDLFALRRTLVGDQGIPEFAVHVSGLSTWLARLRIRVPRSAGR